MFLIGALMMVYNLVMTARGHFADAAASPQRLAGGLAPAVGD
jgi:cbb3-type cytochrome oxidase subunit 1